MATRRPRASQTLTAEKKDQILVARTSGGHTYKAMADACEWDQSNLHNFLNDKPNPKHITYARLRRLCVFLGLDPTKYVEQTDMLLDHDLVRAFKAELGRIENESDDGVTKVVVVISIYKQPNQHKHVQRLHFPLNGRARWRSNRNRLA